MALGFSHDLFLLHVEVTLVESGVECVQVLRYLGFVSRLHWSLLLFVPCDHLDPIPVQLNIVTVNLFSSLSL